MRRTVTLIAGIALVITGLMAPIGCSGGFLGAGSVSFAELMTCSFVQQSSQGDLQFLANGATLVQLGNRPGSEVNFQITIVNRGTGQAANIPLSSNLRLFLSLYGSPDPNPANNQNNDPLGQPLPAFAAPNSARLDANDYLVGEYVIPGLFANRFVAINNFFVIPNPQGPTGVPGRFNDDYFRVAIPPQDPNAPQPNLGPARIYYEVIAVLDSSNCVLEATGAANPEPATREDQRNANAQPIATYVGNATDGFGQLFNNQAIIGRITVVNPSLPNLTIKFVDRQPDTPVSQLGGFVITQWEIGNAGLGAVPQGQQYHVRVYWSEDEENIDAWDINLITNALVAQGTYSGTHNRTTLVSSNTDGIVLQGDGFGAALNAGSNTVVTIVLEIPYVVTRRDFVHGFGNTTGRRSWFATTPASPPNDLVDRRRDIANSGPFGLLVYAPIPTNNNTGNILIARVDATNLVNEADETDNTSSQGDNDRPANGTLDIMGEQLNGQGPEELTCLQVDVSIQQDGQPDDFFEFSIRYNYLQVDVGRPGVSTGFYISFNDVAQSADFFSERFWLPLLPGNGLLFTARYRFPWEGNIPAPGLVYFVVVLDDNFAHKEQLEDDNYRLSSGQVQIR